MAIGVIEDLLYYEPVCSNLEFLCSMLPNGTVCHGIPILVHQAFSFEALPLALPRSMVKDLPEISDPSSCGEEDNFTLKPFALVIAESCKRRLSELIAKPMLASSW
jgi:hypothetical protein